MYFNVKGENLQFMVNVDDWLTVHRSTTLVVLQLDAQNFVYLHMINLLKSSTCFEHYPAHIQLRNRPPEEEQGNVRDM
jgi:hypothetical protein